MSLDRRAVLGIFPALLALGPHRVATASPDRRLANRLELWGSYARRTQNLMARLTARRETSLLEEPLLSTGMLVFEASSRRLVLRDDGLQGSTTLIDGDQIRVFLNRTGPADPSATVADPQPAARWLAHHLRAMFAPDDDGRSLLEEARTHVPKGRGHRLELMPPRGSAIRRRIRSVSMRLDAVAGTVTQIALMEAQGDRLTLGLSDHRQNLPSEDIESFMQQIEGE